MGFHMKVVLTLSAVAGVVYFTMAGIAYYAMVELREVLFLTH